MQKLPIQGVLCGVDAFTRHIIAGPCYHIVAVVDGLLCGLVGKIVTRMEKNCKRLLAMSSAGRALGVACVI